MPRNNLKFIRGVDISSIKILPFNETKYLFNFDDSYEKISNCKLFLKLASDLNTKYNKHNLFHQSKLASEVELQKTHIVFCSSHREMSDKSLH